MLGVCLLLPFEMYKAVRVRFVLDIFAKAIASINNALGIQDDVPVCLNTRERLSKFKNICYFFNFPPHTFCRNMTIHVTLLELYRRIRLAATLSCLKAMEFRVVVDLLNLDQAFF